jgi:hypothetical protein
MNPTRCFEALEPRALLSAPVAPVATVQSFAVTAATISVVVQYTASAGIDRASIDGDELGLTGPNVSRLGYPQVVSEQSTQIVVRYSFGHLGPWPNGTYNLGIPAGTVRSRDGLGIATTGAGSYWVWLPDTIFEVDGMSFGSNSLGVSVSWSTRNPGGTVPVSVKLMAPDGSERVQTQTLASPNYQNFAYFRFDNPGGRPLDYTDPHGAYIAALGDYNGDQLVGYHPAAQSWWWFSSPRVELLSTNVTDSVAQFVVRVSDDHGVDLASMRGTNAWQNVTVGIGPYGVLPPSLSPSGVPLEPLLEPQPDGSVIATYWRAIYGRNFTNTETGEWTYRTEGFYTPRDIDGHRAYDGILGRETHVFTTINTLSVRLETNPGDSRHFMFTVNFSPQNVDTTMFGDGDVRLELAGHTYQLSLAYGVLTHDPYNPSLFYRAYFMIQLPVGETLQTGTANFYLNAGAVTVSGMPNTELLLGSWWMWFS